MLNILKNIGVKKMDKIDFGKHQGARWEHIPKSYLVWMVNEKGMRREAQELAKKELDRRGTPIGREVELSGHAIDRAPQYLLGCYVHETNKKVGIYTWLHNKASEAIKKGKKLEGGKIVNNGIIFVFEFGNYFPSLKTVIYRKKK